MSKFKSKAKEIGKWLLDIFKHSIMPLIMYITCSVVLFMFAFNEDTTWKTGFTTVRIWLCIGSALIPMIYQGVLAFLSGANGYEMLVAGNVKRTAYEGGELNMSSHKEHQEYRTWKGFALGGMVAVTTVVLAIIWGCNQGAIDGILTMENTEAVASTNPVLGGFMVGSVLCWGWALLPCMLANASGVFVSYFLMIPVAILPVAIAGGFYIIGAYARRRKRLAKLDAEEKALAEKEAKPKKVNYGGLPGTKPNKKK